MKCTCKGANDMRKALPLLLVLLLVSQVEAQIFRRYSRPIRSHHCGWAGCDMCNRMFGFLPGRTPRPLPQIDSTPHEVVKIMVAALKLTQKDRFFDLGCGDGRALLEAVRQSGCRAAGVEIDARVAAVAKDNVSRSGFAHRIRVTHADATRYNDLTPCTAIFFYLHPATIAKILPRLTLQTRCVSYMHPLPGVPCTIIRAPNGAPIYVSIQPGETNSWKW